MEVVLPVEVEIPSLSILMEAEIEEANWVQARYEQLILHKSKIESFVIDSVTKREWFVPIQKRMVRLISEEN